MYKRQAIDQVLHDVCMQKLHVVFAIDRAGLVGSDGETHNGCFDLSYLSMMPVSYTHLDVYKRQRVLRRRTLHRAKSSRNRTLTVSCRYNRMNTLCFAKNW